MTADHPTSARQLGCPIGIVQRMSMGPGWHIEYGETRYAQIFPPRQGRPTWLAITTLHRPDGGSASPPRRREGRRLAGLSPGADFEVGLAIDLGLPIFALAPSGDQRILDLEALREWAAEHQEAGPRP